MTCGVCRDFNFTLEYLHNGPRSQPSLTTVSFLWRPFLANVSTALAQLASLPQSQRPRVAMFGAGQWDLLHIHDATHFERQAKGLQNVLELMQRQQQQRAEASEEGALPWLVATTMPRTTSRFMRDAAKEQHMGATTIAAQNQVLRQAYESADVVVDLHKVMELALLGV